MCKTYFSLLEPSSSNNLLPHLPPHLHQYAPTLSFIQRGDGNQRYSVSSCCDKIWLRIISSPHSTSGFLHNEIQAHFKLFQSAFSRFFRPETSVVNYILIKNTFGHFKSDVVVLDATKIVLSQQASAFQGGVTNLRETEKLCHLFESRFKTLCNLAVLISNRVCFVFFKQCSSLSFKHFV